MEHPLPDAALDGRLCVVGISGSGKSTTAKGGVERLLEQGRRVCIVDLLDGWWGLRLGRDGKSPAFPVAIFGGLHGDLPLTEHAGALIGQAVAQSEGSTIVSLAELDGDAPRRRFALAFFDALHKANRAPLHLIVDEADFYAPQQPVKDGPGPMLLNRVKEIAARGRMRGFRLWSITQRPAKLHKDVMSQADTLVAMQLTSSQDRGALKAWIGDQGDESVGAGILRALPSLKRGEGVVWSPRLGVLETTHFPLPETYDSSRTPEYGETAASVDLKPVDLGALRENLGKVEAEVKANDPATLRAEVARLKTELAKKAGNATNAELQEAQADGVQQGLAEATGHCRDALRVQVQRLQDVAQKAVLAAAEEMKAAAEWVCPRAGRPTPTPGITHRQEPYSPPAVTPAVIRDAARAMERAAPKPSVEGVRGPMQRILDACAWWEAVGVNRPSKVQVAVVANYSPGGGAFNNPLGRLRSMGFVEPAIDGTVSLMALGRAAAHNPTIPPTTADLHQRAMAILNGPQQRILAPLLAKYPLSMPKAVLAEAAGYSPDGGAFNNPLGSLRSLGFIDYPERGQVVARPILFVER